MRGSMFCDRSHHTVAFCFRINATYEVETAMVEEREEVERRGTAVDDPVVPWRCILLFWPTEPVVDVVAVEKRRDEGSGIFRG